MIAFETLFALLYAFIYDNRWPRVEKAYRAIVFADGPRFASAEDAIKQKAARPQVEKMITLGKRGDVHARRQALAYLMTDDAVKRLFDTVAPRYGDRQGGYLRIVRTGFQKGDGAEKAFIELLGAEKQLDEKRQKRADVKAKKRAELEEAMEKEKNAPGADDAAA